MKETNRARATKRRQRGQAAAGGEEGDDDDDEEEELVSRRNTARNTSTPKASKGMPGWHATPSQLHAADRH
jgi:hypothetical protein